MNMTRKILVNLLATTAFLFLFLLPVIGFKATSAGAAQTTGNATAYSNDYVFFIVQDNEVPLAAAPTTNLSSYILWVGLAAFVITIAFIYSAWYVSIRRNIRELSRKLSPVDRKAFRISQGYLHPLKSYHLAKEAEVTVASMYTRYI